ncbi:unnamed protein product [Paramecium sonneborni]|uniref:Uncharacterized protein n=1 Tax=Paramecium sonneborni TaxID=65129 RepID=A0A8S1QV27_9CILI|nr:unnamed protein product [Paramecium sonneborni]
MNLTLIPPQEKDENLRMATIFESLSHRNFSKFKEIYQKKQRILQTVMEYIDGGGLTQKIQEAQGIYLIEIQIQITKEGQVKLGDFRNERIFKISFEQYINRNKILEKS